MIFYKGIVGHGIDKFTPETEFVARRLVSNLLDFNDVLGVSGHSPLGGVDIFVEEESHNLSKIALVYKPLGSSPSWNSVGGYKERNIKIAEKSNIVHVIVVAEYPHNYPHEKLFECYHCHKSDHVKSGGCWTAYKALELGKPAAWHIIQSDGTVKTRVYKKSGPFTLFYGYGWTTK